MYRKGIQEIEFALNCFGCRITTVKFKYLTQLTTYPENCDKKYTIYICLEILFIATFECTFFCFIQIVPDFLSKNSMENRKQIDFYSKSLSIAQNFFFKLFVISFRFLIFIFINIFLKSVGKYLDVSFSA